MKKLVTQLCGKCAEKYGIKTLGRSKGICFCGSGDTFIVPLSTIEVEEKEPIHISIENCYNCPFADSFGNFCLVGDWNELLKHPTEKLDVSKCPLKGKKVILEKS
jgi:hypothetical protein